MPQFLVGFLCGFVSAALMLCLLYEKKKGQSEDDAEKGAGKKEKGDSRRGTEVDSANVRVLLVDDSKLSRIVIKEFLADRNWNVFEAGDDTECLRLAKKYKFDLIFLDQNMRGLNCDEMLQRLWEEGGVEKSVPVIAVRASVRKEKEEQFKAMGYAACLGKPIQRSRMDEILAGLFPENETLREPEGFSYEKGLKNFDGNEEMYRETLVLFAELWEERREQLRLFLEEENMEEYAILIHAVKGDARTLGAMAFGESAYEQELKAKQGDVGAIQNSFQRVIQEGDRNAEFFRTKFS